MKEASAMLLDENGNIKPFNQYLNDVKKVNETYNHNYLRTEYDLVVNSANAAAAWEDAQNDDGGRYVLQYRTAGDNKVREEHAKLDGTTLPVSDSFWDLFYPPNGWNCRCKAQKVRASKYPLSDSQQAMQEAAHATNTKSGKMFRFNPGKQKSLFPKHNSYTIAKCSTCDKNIKLAKVPSNELCAACPIIVSIADEKAKIETRKRAKELRKIASEKLKNTEVECPNLNEKIRFKKKGIKEFLNQPHKHYGQKNELILNIENVIKNSTYKGVSEYKSNPTEPRVHLLEIEIENEKSWLIIKENKQEGLLFYSISDSEKILNHTKEKDT